MPFKIKKIKPFKDCSQEKVMFCTFVLSFSILTVSELSFPVWRIIQIFLSRILISNALKEIVSSVSAGVVAAYIFYIFVDLLPRNKKKRQDIQYLDSILFVVLDAFYDSSIVGPSLPIHVSVDIKNHNNKNLTKCYIDNYKVSLIKESEKGKIYSILEIDPIRQVAKACKERLPILVMATKIANDLSLRQGLIWSDVIGMLDCVSNIYSKDLDYIEKNNRLISSVVASLFLIERWIEER